MAEKHPPTSQPRTPAQLKDVKLKDRIHLFEEKSNQPVVNKNMSANNSEQARYPKVVSPEHKRWSQVETDMPGVLTPPWLKLGKNEPPRSPISTGVMSPAAAERSKIRSKTLVTRPSPTVTKNGQFTFAEVDKGKPPLPGKPTNVAQTRSDVVYVKGTPVRLRNGRKCSADYPEARSTVFEMIKNFETKEDTRVEKGQPKQNGASLDVIPGNNIHRRSAELNRLSQENETRTRPVPPPRRLQRRRSKSVSDIHSEVESIPEPLLPPAKPKRTYDHDIYEESKVLMKQKRQLPNSGLKNSRLVNPLYEIGPDEEDEEDKPKGRPQFESSTPDAKMPGRHKELPPVPNIPPYTPPLHRPRGQSSEVSTVDSVSPSGLTDPLAPERPRSETTPVSKYDRHPANSLTRSHSSEDVGKEHQTPGYMYKPPKQFSQLQERKQTGRVSDYDEPIYPLYPKSKTGEDSIVNEPDRRDTVIDADGYSVPGSHLWKKPEPHDETKKPTFWHGRVMSLKPGIPARVTSKLSRSRKTSSEKRAVATHTYTEPGSHVEHDSGLEPSIRQRSRLLTMRRKLNDAFHIKHPRNPKTLQEDDRISVTSEDSDGEVNEAVMHKRLTHARAVKKRSSVYCNVDRRIISESKLYDYLLVITLKYNEETRRYYPVEKYRYPEEISSSQNDKLRAIPHFCFPDAFKWAPVEEYNSESYSFVLTSMDGSRLYGYNRRLLPPGDKPRLPEVYCIITPISCSLLYTQLLDGIEKRRHRSRWEMEKLIREAHKRTVPLPGKSICIMEMGEDIDKRTSMVQPLALQRPKDSRLEHVDIDCLFNALEITQVIQVFASLLFERRIIMFSGKISKLSKCSQAAAALLYPFAWQHVYVPVLPEKLIDMSCSPTPYIMGMLALCIPNVEMLPIDEALLVDLDSRDFYTCVGDEETIIPRKLSQALERALKDIFKNCTGDNEGCDHETKNRAISEVFIRFFVETCGHYVTHFTSDFEGNLKFDREGFIAAVPSRSIRRFLEVFTETQMFSLFIQEKETEVEGISQGLFETRVREWEAECKVNANKFGARVKKIGKVVREGGKMMADTANVVRTKVKANLDSKV
ncbi:DENN domain-containing protein 2C-like isoform X2 [Patiria miniata]|uniref:UDENN domain-containing protein n=1 Tax=Patiria miniata TaxID=46514 RepID=A0A913ZNB9_PATMI|nr:DENN domain-containing protein 2C-like isoform X2 [Patiria miniata]